MTATFDLGAMLSTPQAVKNSVQQIPCDMLRPYHAHKFSLYTGERLDDMVESVKENGVLTPIVVQPVADGYEILIGHNRWNACKIAGIQTIPAIVKEGLTEDEAEMYVVESNLIQREFGSLKISEQAEVIAMRYNKMFSQGKRNDIIRELQMIENPEIAEDTTKTSREKVGDEYGLSRNSVARLIRISKLIDVLKTYVDSGTIAVRTAVNLSYLSAETQQDIADFLEEYKVDMKKSELLKANADEDGNVEYDKIAEIIVGESQEIPKPKSVKISHDTFSRYFEVGTKPKKITETIEKALAFYFANAEQEESE